MALTCCRQGQLQPASAILYSRYQIFCMSAGAAAVSHPEGHGLGEPSQADSTITAGE